MRVAPASLRISAARYSSTAACLCLCVRAGCCWCVVIREVGSRSRCTCIVVFLSFRSERGGRQSQSTSAPCPSKQAKARQVVASPRAASPSRWQRHPRQQEGAHHPAPRAACRAQPRGAEQAPGWHHHRGRRLRAKRLPRAPKFVEMMLLCVVTATRTWTGIFRARVCVCLCVFTLGQICMCMSEPAVCVCVFM